MAVQNIERQRAGGFSSGWYHRKYEKRAQRGRVHTNLEGAYERSQQLTRDEGWGSPFREPGANILLCGTASSETSIRFARFVNEINPSAAIHIIDRESFPLDKSRERFQGEFQYSTAIDIRQEDATSTSFDNNYFSGIETDFLLQFLPTNAKNTLFQEWFRILKPGGVITTRDFLQTDGSLGEKAGSYLVKVHNRFVHAPKSFSIGTMELENMLTDAGFEVKIVSKRTGKERIPDMHLVHDIIARKPLPQVA